MSDVLEGMPAVWGRCPHCSTVIFRDYTIAGYCEDCAAAILRSLSEPDIAQVWKTLDKPQLATNERANRDRLHDGL